MDVSGVNSAAISMVANTEPPTREAISVSVQKKAMDIEKQTAAQLIASIEQSTPKPKSSGPIGGNIDVKV
jgi:hypothetical protein